MTTTASTDATATNGTSSPPQDPQLLNKDEQDTNETRRGNNHKDDNDNNNENGTACYYDAILPIPPSRDMLIRVGMDDQGRSVFVGYDKLPDGRDGPAQVCELVKNEGDIICAINHVSTEQKTYWQVLKLLQNACANSYVMIRFQDVSRTLSTPSNPVGHNVYGTESALPWLQTDRKRFDQERQQWEMSASQWAVEKQELQSRVQRKAAVVQKLEQQLQASHADHAQLEQSLRSTKQQLTQAKAEISHIMSVRAAKHKDGDTKDDADRPRDTDSAALKDDNNNAEFGTSPSATHTTTPSATALAASTATFMLSSSSNNRPRNKLQSKLPPHLSPVPSYDNAETAEKEAKNDRTAKPLAEKKESPSEERRGSDKGSNLPKNKAPRKSKKRGTTDDAEDEGPGKRDETNSTETSKLHAGDKPSTAMPKTKKRKKHHAKGAIKDGVTAEDGAADGAANRKHGEKEDEPTMMPAEANNSSDTAVEEARTLDQQKPESGSNTAVADDPKPVAKEATVTNDLKHSSPLKKRLKERKYSEDRTDDNVSISEKTAKEDASSVGDEKLPSRPDKKSPLKKRIVAEENEAQASPSSSVLKSKDKQGYSSSKPAAAEESSDRPRKSRSDRGEVGHVNTGEEKQEHKKQASKPTMDNKSKKKKWHSSTCPQASAVNDGDHSTKSNKVNPMKKTPPKKSSDSAVPEDKKFSGKEGEAQCGAHMGKSIRCKYCAVQGSLYCHSHADYIAPVSPGLKQFRGEPGEVQCKGKTLAGNRCKYCAMGGTKYCSFHVEGTQLQAFRGLEGERQCVSSSVRGKRCKWRASEGSKYCRVHSSFESMEGKEESVESAYTGAENEVRCDIISRRGRKCIFIASENSKMCTYHSEKLAKYSDLKRFKGRRGEVQCEAGTEQARCKFCTRGNSRYCAFHSNSYRRSDDPVNHQEETKRKRKRERDHSGEDGDEDAPLSSLSSKEKSTDHRVKKRRSLIPDDGDAQKGNRTSKMNPPELVVRRSSSRALKLELNAMKKAKNSDSKSSSSALKKKDKDSSESTRSSSKPIEKVKGESQVFRHPVGTMVKKHFDEHGWFVGEVDAVENDRYHVRYEDGDEEEFMFAEQHLLDAIVVKDMRKVRQHKKRKQTQDLLEEVGDTSEDEDEQDKKTGQKKKNLSKNHTLFADTDESDEDS